MTLHHRLKPANVSGDEMNAALAVDGLLHNAVLTVQFSQSPLGELALTECLEALQRTAAKTTTGDLSSSEALLTAQAVTLNALFTRLALRAKDNMGTHLEATDRYLRLALKAQSQCRATIETLANIKSPPTVFARQANIAHGPQQVNNGTASGHPDTVELSRAENSDSAPNRLLEAHDKQLDTGTTRTSVSSDQVLAPLGVIHRSA